MGRAPIVKTSRRIPPTPVAAPWYGSTADGWLCDSILNAMASPSPIEIAPAFSPGPCSTHGAVVGSVRRMGLECLYEQCSLQSALIIPSSVNVGCRPSIATSRSNSAGVSPCSATRAGEMTGSPARGVAVGVTVTGRGAPSSGPRRACRSGAPLPSAAARALPRRATCHRSRCTRRRPPGRSRLP